MVDSAIFEYYTKVVKTSETDSAHSLERLHPRKRTAPPEHSGRDFARDMVAIAVFLSVLQHDPCCAWRTSCT